MIGWTAAAQWLALSTSVFVPLGTPDAPAPIVVVGVGGLAWEHISPEDTPRLWGMLDDGASAAAVSVRQGAWRSCPADGWLSLSAGQRAKGPRTGDRCEMPDVSAWSSLVALQDSSTYDPELGSLGETLAAHDICATAVGPGAALALAEEDGSVARAHRDLRDDSFDCPITMVDAGAVPDLATVDRRVGEVLDRAPPSATVLVVSVSDIPGGPVELGVALLAGAGESRLLRTATTRWDGVIRLLDVSSTLTAAVDVSDPGGFYGAPVTLGADRPDDTVGHLHDITRTDRVLRRWSATFFNWPAAAQLVLYAAALLWAWRRRLPFFEGDWLLTNQSPSKKVWFVGVALGFASLPMAAYLVTLTGWWRGGSPDRALWLGMTGIAAAVALAVGLIRPRQLWWPAGAIAGLTFVVLTLDGITGTRLHRGSLLGPSPALGGRFYGFGNPTFSIYVVAAIVAAGAGAAELLSRGRRRAATAAVVGIGVVAMVVDVWPTWGGDVGGGLAMVPGFVLLTLMVADLRVTLPRLAAAAGAGVVVVAAMGFADWLRPERQRSHIGRFVQEIFDGEAWSIVARKAGYARGSFDAGLPAWITLVVLVAAVVAVVRPDRVAPPPLRTAFAAWPTLHATVSAVLLTTVLGAVVNDYGIRIATIALPALFPLVAVACATAAGRCPPRTARSPGPGAGSAHRRR